MGDTNKKKSFNKQKLKQKINIQEKKNQKMSLQLKSHVNFHDWRSGEMLALIEPKRR